LLCRCSALYYQPVEMGWGPGRVVTNRQGMQREWQRQVVHAVKQGGTSANFPLLWDACSKIIKGGDENIAVLSQEVGTGSRRWEVWLPALPVTCSPGRPVAGLSHAQHGDTILALAAGLDWFPIEGRRRDCEHMPSHGCVPNPGEKLTSRGGRRVACTSP